MKSTTYKSQSQDVKLASNSYPYVEYLRLVEDYQDPVGPVYQSVTTWSFSSVKSRAETAGKQTVSAFKDHRKAVLTFSSQQC